MYNVHKFANQKVAGLPFKYDSFKHSYFLYHFKYHELKTHFMTIAPVDVTILRFIAARLPKVAESVPSAPAGGETGIPAAGNWPDMSKSSRYSQDVGDTNLLLEVLYRVERRGNSFWTGIRLKSNCVFASVLKASWCNW